MDLTDRARLREPADVRRLVTEGFQPRVLLAEQDDLRVQPDERLVLSAFAGGHRPRAPEPPPRRRRPRGRLRAPRGRRAGLFVNALGGLVLGAHPLTTRNVTCLWRDFWRPLIATATSR